MGARDEDPRQVRLAEGGDVLGRHDGAARIVEILRDYCAPEAAGAIRPQVMRFTHYGRADQSIGEYTVEYDLLRRKAESKMGMGAGLPERFVSVFLRELRGTDPPGKIAGGGQRSQKPEVRRSVGERATIIWIAQR